MRDAQNSLDGSWAALEQRREQAELILRAFADWIPQSSEALERINNMLAIHKLPCCSGDDAIDIIEWAAQIVAEFPAP